MALAGHIGAEISPPDNIVGVIVPLHGWLFGEDQGRYIIAVKDANAVMTAAQSAKVPAWKLGKTVTAGANAALTVAGLGTISLSELRDAHEGWLPSYMAAAE
jgi:phosphoribosylformylglycinamidine (FGAM) synthase-like enzyme